MLNILALNTTVSGCLLRLFAVGIALTVSGAGFVLHSLGVNGSVERRVLEVAAPLLPREIPAAPPVVLVTIQDLNRQTWPWKNLDYAVFLNSLAEFAPAVVALDLPLLAGETDYKIYDTQLGKQIRRFGRVVLSDAANADLAQHASVAPLLLTPDADGVLRKIPLTVSGSPTFVLQTYAQYLNAAIVSGEREITLRAADGHALQRIPVDDDGCLTLNFQTGDLNKIPAHEFYQMVVSSEQLRNNLPPIVDLVTVSGKILLVGAEAAGTCQPVMTVSGKVAPVRVAWQALQNLFAADFQRPVPMDWVLAALLMATLMVSQFALIKNFFARVLMVMLLLCAVLSLSGWLLVEQQLTSPAATVSGCVVLTWLLSRGLACIFAAPRHNRRP